MWWRSSEREREREKEKKDGYGERGEREMMQTLSNKEASRQADKQDREKKEMVMGESMQAAGRQPTASLFAHWS